MTSCCEDSALWTSFAPRIGLKNLQKPSVLHLRQAATMCKQRQCAGCSPSMIRSILQRVCPKACVSCQDLGWSHRNSTKFDSKIIAPEMHEVGLILLYSAGTLHRLNLHPY